MLPPALHLPFPIEFSPDLTDLQHSLDNMSDNIYHQPPSGFSVTDATYDDVDGITQLWYDSFFRSHEFWKCATPDDAPTRQWLNDLWTIRIRAGPSFFRTFVVKDLSEDNKIVAFSQWMVPQTDEAKESYMPDYPPGWDLELANALWDGMGEYKAEIMRGKRFLLGEFIGINSAYRRQRLGAMLMDWGCRQADAAGVEAFHFTTKDGRLLHQSVGYQDMPMKPLTMPLRPQTYGTYEVVPQLRTPRATA
ncbi:hypothetical protein TWF694_007775 [Orbilia ellipsospora]|uniref:N-acetyltransferase domain-containing protein n=1 Tax=Orbilia ellipsospora TaxID=2528407 RepID=A0AAV9XIQ1_9PEZI